MCDVFPPFHILNVRFSSGGSDGDMGPGAVWKPFQISEAEYRELLLAALKPDTEKLEAMARFYKPEMFVDPALDHIPDLFEWIEAAAKKHRIGQKSRIVI